MATNKAKIDCVKSKESVDRQKYEFKTLDEWGLTKIARELEKQFTPQELEQIQQEVKKRNDDK